MDDGQAALRQLYHSNPREYWRVMDSLVLWGRARFTPPSVERTPAEQFRSAHLSEGQQTEKETPK